MNQYLKISALFLLTIQFISCLEIPTFNKEEKLSIANDFNTVTVNDYSLAIPHYMKIAKNLNQDASLQYQNIYKEVYVVVIDEKKEELKSTFKALGEWDDTQSISENYRDIQLGFLRENITITKQFPAKSLNINGLEAQVVDIDGKVDGILYDIAYTIAFIEGDTNTYMLMVWTLKNKRDKLRNTFEQIVNSFKLIK